MSYRIEYGKNPRCAMGNKRKSWQRALLVLGIVMAGAAVGFYVLQEVGIRKLLPGDPAVTGAALDHMLESWRSGTSIGQAFTAFCQEVISYAQILE